MKSIRLIVLILTCITASNSAAEEIFKFPNGLSIELEESEISVLHDNYRLVDTDGDQFIELDIYFAHFHKDYVYGYGTYCPSAEDNCKHNYKNYCTCSFRYFIYKKGDKGTIIFEWSDAFKEYLKNNNFPEWSVYTALFDGRGYRNKRFNDSCQKTEVELTIPDIKLPNSLHLVHDHSALCDSRAYKLTDENFKPVIQPYIRYADWHGDYVYGYAYNYRGIERNPHYGLINFIYKKGDKDAKFFESPFNFRDYIKSLGLPKWDPHSPGYEPLFDSYKFQERHGFLEKRLKSSSPNAGQQSRD